MPRTSSNPGQRSWTVEDGSELVIDSPVDLDFVRTRNTRSGADAVALEQGCTGRVKFLDVETRAADGLKVRNSGPRFPRDFTVERGRIICLGRSPEAVHQDGIQVMGGHRLRFLGLDIYGAAVQGIFVNTGGGGASQPTDIEIRGCRVGYSGATGINIGTYAGSMIVTGNEVWASTRWGRDINPNTFDDGNILRARDYPWTERYADGPGPDPEPEPEPDGELEELRRRVNELEGLLADCGFDRAALEEERDRILAAVASARAALDVALPTFGVSAAGRAGGRS